MRALLTDDNFLHGFYHVRIPAGGLGMSRSSSDGTFIVSNSEFAVSNEAPFDSVETASEVRANGNRRTVRHLGFQQCRSKRLCVKFCRALLDGMRIFIGKVVFICLAVNLVLKFLGQPGETRFQPGGDEISLGVPFADGVGMLTAFSRSGLCHYCEIRARRRVGRCGGAAPPGRGGYDARPRRLCSERGADS